MLVCDQARLARGQFYSSACVNCDHSVHVLFVSGGAPIRHGMDGCAEQKSPATPLPCGKYEIPRRGLARESLVPTILVRWRR